MRGGFTFKGIHSSVYGVRETPDSRILSPLKRRSLIQIPGRSVQIIQEDGGYEPRVESIICSYALRPGENIYQQARLIAAWLDGVGELTFDYEPTLHYNAYLSSPPPTVKMLEFLTFSLEFTMVHPFAYETAQQQNDTLGTGQYTVELEVEGTVETPVIIKITNLTNKALTDLKIYHKIIET